MAWTFWASFFFLPIVILCFGSVLFFIYDIIFNFERYLDTWRYRADSELLLHIAYCAIFFMSFVFAAILNYFIFAPRHYPIRFNRKQERSIFVIIFLMIWVINRPIPSGSTTHSTNILSLNIKSTTGNKFKV